jgi:hypothetical protein
MSKKLVKVTINGRNPQSPGFPGLLSHPQILWNDGNRVFPIYGEWRMASANDDSREPCALYVSEKSRKARIHSFFCSVFENIPRNNTRE